MPKLVVFLDGSSEWSIQIYIGLQTLIIDMGMSPIKIDALHD